MIVDMTGTAKAVGVVVGIAAAIIVASAFITMHAAAQSSPTSLTQTYTNETFGFSLQMPADFVASDAGQVASTSGEAVVLQHGQDAVQMVITPYGEDLHALTKDQIEQDEPYLSITDEQPIEIAPGYKGLSFRSDGAFGTSSSNVWFVYHGNLYQLTTYAQLDGLLKSMVVTWRLL
jgi:hypothetical protein